MARDLVHLAAVCAPAPGGQDDMLRVFEHVDLPHLLGSLLQAEEGDEAAEWRAIITAAVGDPQLQNFICGALASVRALVRASMAWCAEELMVAVDGAVPFPFEEDVYDEYISDEQSMDSAAATAPAAASPEVRQRIVFFVFFV